jgi:hypothetical protein
LFLTRAYLVNINAVNQWIARYKKDGIKGAIFVFKIVRPLQCLTRNYMQQFYG